MKSIKIIRLRNVSGKCILIPVEAIHMNQEGAVIMKKYNDFVNVRKENSVLRYAGGVPAAEKKRFWAQSPWGAFRLLLQGA